MKIFKVEHLAISLSLLLGLGFISDADVISELTDQLATYRKDFPQTKLHLSFDQPAYAPGDTAYMKAYLVTEDLKPVRGRQVIHFALMDENGKTSINESFTIDNGVTANQLIIPKTFLSGNYQLAAHTNWMKNFPREYYFSTPFKVADEYQFTSAQSNDIQIELHAEGGNIVSEISNHIVAYATRGGVPFAVTGRILNDEGTEILQVQCDNKGLASFEWTPSKRYQYSIETAGQKTPIAIKPEGCTIRISNEGELLKADIGFRSTDDREESIYVILTSRSEIRYASMIRVKNENASPVYIPKRSIPEGIAELTLFDKNSKIIAKRILFVDYGSEPQVSLNIKGQPFTTRSPLTLELDVKDPYGTSKQTEILVTAFYEDLFSTTQLSDFREQMLIASDVPGSQYFLDHVDIRTDDGLNALDQFLITKKNQRFSWEEVFAHKGKSPEFRMEGTLNYKGIATYNDTGKAVPDSTLVLFLLQNEIFGYEVYTSQDGKFEWPVFFDFYGNDQIMYSMEYKGKRLENTTVKLLEDSLNGFIATPTEYSNRKNPYYAFSTIADVAGTSFSYAWSGKDSVKANSNPNAAFEDELSGADATMNIDDYIVFPTMEDLFREVIRFVQHRRIGGKPTLRVLSSDSNNPIMGEPLYVVDGIPTRNTDFILSLKPAEIAVVKVINNVRKLRTMGQLTKNGVVFFQTKVADINARIPRNDIINLKGLNRPIPFKAESVAASQSMRVPVLKSSLCWVTELERNERGLASSTFYTGDNTGKVKVVVRGITVDGAPFHYEQAIDISFLQANKE